MRIPVGAAGGRLPNNSINPVTCHDGFTLHDLVSYEAKHNQANGEDNRDGSDANLSWNCGAICYGSRASSSRFAAGTGA